MYNVLASRAVHTPAWDRHQTAPDDMHAWQSMEALFSFSAKFFHDTVVFSFVCVNYCSIMD
jgi:hypothetical protein